MNRRSALASCLIVVLSALVSSPAVSITGVIPIPHNKPFMGPVPLDKPLSQSTIAKTPITKDVMTVESTCQHIGNKLASVKVGECLAFGFSPSGRSAAGAPILARDYGGDSRQPVNARILLVGGTHGDEYSSVSVVFKWMAFLAHSTHAFQWRVAPLLNPDGLLRQKSTRTNANGVDLNRNLPTPNWLQESSHYWVNKTGSNPRRYPGNSALSEPENQWLVGEINTFRPNVIIATHAPHGIVDFDGPPKGPTQIGALAQRFLGTYPGSLGNFAGLHLGLPVVTIELESAGSMPSAKEIERMWGDLLNWLESRFPAPAQAALRADAGQL